MRSPKGFLRIRRPGVVLAMASVLLLGCARKVQIQVPADFHGRIHIVCQTLTDDRVTTLRVDSTGELSAPACPTRQTDAVVTRSNGSAPIDTSVLWTTTGDGLVREISFQVN